jgi:uncharacterized protein YjbI with pentapeptide repeats
LQNQLVEAQRRSSLVFELSSILDEIDEERDEYAQRAKPVTALPEDPDFAVHHEELIAERQQLLRDPSTIVDDTSAALTRGAKESYNSRLDGMRPRKRDFAGNHPLFMLSDRLSGRIAAISRALRPYRYLDDTGRLSSEPLSPERGQLLTSLISSDVDTFELNHFSPVFDRADLAQAEFSDIPIEHLSARNARFDGATLINVQFTYSNLGGSSFRNATLNGVKIDSLEGACLEGANLSGEFDNLRHSDLTGAKIRGARFGDLSHAILKSVSEWFCIK